MRMVCLDLEGVLTPEIWIAVAEETSTPELRLTTRDIPDYDELMQRRISILRSTDLRLPAIQRVIASLKPLEGAVAFLNRLRAERQVIILSDTFEQFAAPLMEKLGRPTLFCNSLEVTEDGSVVGYRLRQRDGKRRAVDALRSLGFHVTGAGDSYNDLTMLRSADEGVLFRPPQSIRSEHPEFPVTDSYDQLLPLLLGSGATERPAAR